MVDCQSRIRLLRNLQELGEQWPHLLEEVSVTIVLEQIEPFFDAQKDLLSLLMANFDETSVSDSQRQAQSCSSLVDEVCVLCRSLIEVGHQ